MGYYVTITYNKHTIQVCMVYLLIKGGLIQVYQFNTTQSVCSTGTTVLVMIYFLSVDSDNDKHFKYDWLLLRQSYDVVMMLGTKQLVTFSSFSTEWYTTCDQVWKNWPSWCKNWNTYIYITVTLIHSLYNITEVIRRWQLARYAF